MQVILNLLTGGLQINQAQQLCDQMIVWNHN